MLIARCFFFCFAFALSVPRNPSQKEPALGYYNKRFIFMMVCHLKRPARPRGARAAPPPLQKLVRRRSRRRVNVTKGALLVCGPCCCLLLHLLWYAMTVFAIKMPTVTTTDSPPLTTPRKKAGVGGVERERGKGATPKTPSAPRPSHPTPHRTPPQTPHPQYIYTCNQDRATATGSACVLDSKKHDGPHAPLTPHAPATARAPLYTEKHAFHLISSHLIPSPTHPALMPPAPPAAARPPPTAAPTPNPHHHPRHPRGPRSVAAPRAGGPEPPGGSRQSPRAPARRTARR